MRTWNELSMAEKADVMKLAIEGGVYDLDSIRSGYNEYARGGKIHIDSSKKGTFTSAASKHGKSVQAFASQVLAHPENYSPAMRKKANFARNAAKWHHAYGGEMGNYYDGWGEAWNFLKRGVQKARQKVKDWGLDKSPGQHLIDLFTEDANPTSNENVTYRNKPAIKRNLITPTGEKYTAAVPKRINRNSSKTREKSEELENRMRAKLVDDQRKNNGSNPVFDVPYIPEKDILINGTTTSTNMLDSLAKYAGIHNRDPKLSESTIKRRSTYPEPRTISLDEMLGLSAQETKNGAQIYFNDKDLNDNTRYSKRDLGNANYFTAFGYVPADNLMRHYNYNDSNIDRNTPPILDAFRYYAQGDYNRNDKNHQSDVIEAGKLAWSNPAVIDWWETSGKYWYNNEKGPKK